MQMRSIVGAASLAILVTTPAHAAAEKTVRTSICALAQHGRELNGRRVRLTATYVTDLQEYTSLTDPHCPKVHVAPYDAESPDESVERFDKAVKGRMEDLSARRFVVELSGRFTWKGHDEPYGSMTIDRVWSFHRTGGGSPQPGH